MNTGHEITKIYFKEKGVLRILELEGTYAHDVVITILDAEGFKPDDKRVLLQYV